MVFCFVLFCFNLWAGSGGNICISAWEWLRPGRGGAHDWSGKTEGAWRAGLGNLALRRACRVGGVQPSGFRYSKSGVLESDETVTKPLCAALCGLGADGDHVLFGVPALHHKPASTLSFPKPQISSTASPCRPRLALTGEKTSLRLGLGIRRPSPGSGPSSVRNLASCPLP